MIVKRNVVHFELEVVTGIHIGGSKETFGIGGTDAPVIKNPLNGEPIIPGSSLKGKIRMLLEKISKQPFGRINLMFGEKNIKEFTPKPTRVIFRDLWLDPASKAELGKRLGENNFTEIKAENSIKQSTGTAEAPRFIERVPAGVKFVGEIVINYHDEDKDLEEFTKLLLEGFNLLENNYLGGSGSRGYGKVRFVNVKVESI